MLSPEQQKLATRSLTHWLQNENRIVNFRELSREVGCHVDIAKNLLLDHLHSNPSLAPTYLLSGNLLSTSRLALTSLTIDQTPTAATQRVKIVDMDEMSDADRNSEDGEDEVGMDADKVLGNDKGGEGGLSGHGGKTGLLRDDDEDIKPEEVKRWGVVLVQGEDLETKKGLFDLDTLSVHVYALSPSPVKDPAQYLIPNLSLRSHPRYFDPSTYGTITGETLTSIDTKPAPKVMKDGDMDWASGKKQIKKEPNPTAVEQSTKPDVEVKATTKTKITDAAPPNEPAVPVKTEKREALKPKSHKRVITSDDEEAPADSSTPGTTLKATPPQPTSSMVRADDKAAMEAMMGMDVDVEIESEAEDEPNASGSSKKADKKGDVEVKKEPGTVGKRKRRMVKKSKIEEGKNGYMITKDYYSEESYSDDSEPDQSEAKPKAAAKTQPRKTSRGSSIGVEAEKTKNTPPPKPSTGGGKKGGQSTLAGFFKKK